MKLKETYSGQEKLFEYLDEYKYPKRHQFVKAFTSKHTHLGHIATSRGEQGHYHFKQFLHGNRHDLLDLKDKWEVMIRVDQVNHAKDLAHQRSRPSHEIQAKRWSEWVEPDLNNFITPAGMELLVKQLYLARDVTADGHCSGSFTTIHNIPCYHHIRLLKQFNRKVTRCQDPGPDKLYIRQILSYIAALPVCISTTLGSHSYCFVNTNAKLLLLQGDNGRLSPLYTPMQHAGCSCCDLFRNMHRSTLAWKLAQ